jgi:hypothetical protein
MASMLEVGLEMGRTIRRGVACEGAVRRQVPSRMVGEAIFMVSSGPMGVPPGESMLERGRA